MRCLHHHPAASIGITLKYQRWLTKNVKIILKNKIGSSKFVFFGHGHKHLKYNSKIGKYANYAKHSKYANSQTIYIKVTDYAKYAKYAKYTKYAKHAKFWNMQNITFTKYIKIAKYTKLQTKCKQIV